MQPNNFPSNQPQQPGVNPPVPQQAAPFIPQQQVPAQGPIGTQAEAKPTPKNPNSTQSTLQLSEVRDGMVIMNDGSFRVVVSCKSINFDLMSDREREEIGRASCRERVF